MASRNEPPDSLDYFPTPPWATRALCTHVLPAMNAFDPDEQQAWEPACGEGHMARPLAEWFARVIASDIHDYGHGLVQDFLGSGLVMQARPVRQPHWIITNPPFRRGAEFIRRAQDIASHGVAMLVRSQFLEGIGRYSDLFRPKPPAIIAQFAERVPMHRGRLTRTGSTATAYCWLVWDLTGSYGAYRPPSFFWIPPCRKQMERPEDYGQAVP